MLCDRAPLSDQALKAYWVFAPPGRVAVVAMVWADPGAHWNVCGAVYAVPSIVRLRPEGFVVMVVESGLKAAVTLRGALKVTFCGVVVPVRSPVNPPN